MTDVLISLMRNTKSLVVLLGAFLKYFSIEQRSIHVSRLTSHVSRNVLFISIFLFLLTTNAHAAFSYYRAVTIDHTKVGTVNNTDQTNFPVLISGTYSYLATTGNGGNVQSASGYDVGFFSNNNCTGKMFWETELYTAASGLVVYWVKVPTVSHTSDTVFYLCYGDAGISRDQSDKINVWDSNFKGVWHLPDGTTLSGADSTNNANNGTVTGATATTAQVDGGASFAGGTNNIDVGNNTALKLTGAITLEAWVNWAVFPTASSATWQTIMDKTDGGFGATSSSDYALNINTSGSGLSFIAGSNGTSSVSLSFSTTLSLSTWYHIVGTWDGTTGANGIKTYVNGALTNQGTAVISLTTDKGTNLHFGYHSGGFGVALNGLLDEVHVSASARSADWIVTEYNNQNSPSTFYAVGSEQSVDNVGHSSFLQGTTSLGGTSRVP